MKKLLLLLLFMTLFIQPSYAAKEMTEGAGVSLSTANGDVTLDIAFDDDEAIVWGTDEELDFESATQDFNFTDDIRISDANPHLDFYDTGDTSSYQFHYESSATYPFALFYSDDGTAYGGYPIFYSDDTNLGVTRGQLLIHGAAAYINFSSTAGTTGYGIYNSGGTMQFKNLGGAWQNMGTGTPGGSDTYVQYNDSTVFGGDAGFTFDENNDYLTVKGGYILGSAIDQNETMLTVDRASTDVVIAWDETNDEIDINYPINIAGANSRLTFDTEEYIESATDDYIEFQGASGTDDTDIRFNLDGAFPIIDCPTDGKILIDAHQGHIDADHVRVNKLDLNAPDNIDGLNKHYRFNIWDPNAMFDDDDTICIDPSTDAALTITSIEVTLDADPTTELDAKLMYADAFVDHPSAVVIDEIDTTSGTTSISSGFDDATVPSGKAIFIRFDGDPDSAITQVNVDIQYDYDVDD